MPQRETLNVSLTAELTAFVEALVTSGRYRSASEVMREGLRLLQAREDRREVILEEIRREIEKGWTAAQKGGLKDGPALLNEWERRLRAMLDNPGRGKKSA